MKLYLHCAEQQRCFSNITECCACHAKRLSWLIRITYETLFTMCGATSRLNWGMFSGLTRWAFEEDPASSRRLHKSPCPCQVASVFMSCPKIYQPLICHSRLQGWLKRAGFAARRCGTTATSVTALVWSRINEFLIEDSLERAGFAARSCGYSRLLSVARRNDRVSFTNHHSMSPMLPLCSL